MKIQFKKPCNGEMSEYDPETEGHFVVALIGTAYPWIGPLPSRQTCQLAYGSVGNPRRTMIEAQRDLCRIYARYGDEVGGAFAIYKTPCALAERSARVYLTCEPDADWLEIAKTVNWENAPWYQLEQYHNGTGRYAFHIGQSKTPLPVA